MRIGGLVVWCMICTISVLSGQFVEPFDDADLTSDVRWLGDVDSFAVMDGQLHLQASAAGSSHLYTAYELQDSLRFGLDVYLDFAPSGSNQFMLSLFQQSPSPDSTPALFMEIGEPGSDDAFNLYEWLPGMVPTFITSFAPIPHVSDMAFRVIVTRIAGTWRIELDHDIDGTVDDSYLLPGTAVSDGPGYFGWEARYTASRADRYRFDNAFIERIIPDRQGPRVIALVAESRSSLRVQFDEDLDTMLIDDSMVDLVDSEGTPYSISSIDFIDEMSALINVVPQLMNRDTHLLTLSGWVDLLGNATDTTVAVYVSIPDTPIYGDVRISEIMAAPSADGALPQAEYVELYNASSKTFDLAAFHISDAGSPRDISTYELSPGQYITLVDEDDVSAFVGIEVVGVDGLPSLSNAADQVILTYQGEVIDAVYYEEAWHDTDDPSGRSLELVDVSSSCRDRVNWRSSRDIRGGTPSAQNSVAGMLDPLGVLVQRVQVTAPDVLHLEINQSLADPTMTTGIIGSITPAVDIDSIRIMEGEGRQVIEVDFIDDLEPSRLYTLILGDALTCAGAELRFVGDIVFGRPFAPESGDVLISEIMYEPLVGGSEYIELYNASDKTISIEDIWLQVGMGDDADQVQLTGSRDLPPGAFAVWADDPAHVLANYDVPAPAILFDYALPTLTDEDRLLVFAFDQEDTFHIDMVDYDADMHHPLLDATRGVALERILLSDEVDPTDNWASAPSRGTPTGPNGASLNPGVQDGSFVLTSKTFSPDSDGFEDMAIITYQLDRPDYLAQVDVYAYDGAPIVQLANNRALGTQGLITWDGADGDGNSTRIGIYYIVIEAFAPDGQVIEERIKVTLARQLD